MKFAKYLRNNILIGDKKRDSSILNWRRSQKFQCLQGEKRAWQQRRKQIRKQLASGDDFVTNGRADGSSPFTGLATFAAFATFDFHVREKAKLPKNVAVL